MSRTLRGGRSGSKTTDAATVPDMSMAGVTR